MSQYKINAITTRHLGGQRHPQQAVAALAGARAPGFMLAVLADAHDDSDGGPAARAASQVLQTAAQLFDEFSTIEATPPAFGAPQFDSNCDKLAATLAALVDEAHTSIGLSTRIGTAPARASMAAFALTPAGEAVWVCLGSARLYRFRAGALLEKNSAPPAATVDAGKPAPPRPPLAESRLGSPRTPLASHGRSSDVQAGDVFLLCSAGLWRYFSDAELGAALARMAPRQASEKLLAKARERSGDSPCAFALVRLDAPAGAA